jgi:hypothetical protein
MNFVVISLSCFGLTELIKRFLIYEFKNNKFVKTVLLPSLSILIGLLLGLIMHNFMSGIVAGLLSSLVYNRAKSFLKQS